MPKGPDNVHTKWVGADATDTAGEGALCRRFDGPRSANHHPVKFNTVKVIYTTHDTKIHSEKAGDTAQTRLKTAFAPGGD